MEDTEPTPEEPTPEEQAEKHTSFYNSVISAAICKGVATVEAWKCPSCGLIQYVLHDGAEVLPCQKPGCSYRYPSRAPRRPQRGEKTLGHVEFALDMIAETNAEAAASLPPIAAGEMAGYSADLRLLLARHTAQVTLGTIKHVRLLAEAAAGVL
jgi:hypothetical protein